MKIWQKYNGCKLFEMHFGLYSCLPGKGYDQLPTKYNGSLIEAIKLRDVPLHLINAYCFN